MFTSVCSYFKTYSVFKRICIRACDMFYAVRVGRIPGIYRTWEECQAQTKQFPKARYKKFPTEALALEFLQSGAPPGCIPEDLQEPQEAFPPAGFLPWFVTGMSNPEIVEAVNNLKFTAKTLQHQLDLMSKAFGTLTEQIESMEKVVKGAKAGGAPKRTHSDEPAEPSGSKGKKAKTDNGEAAGWSGSQFSDPSAPQVYTDGCCFMNGKHGAVAGIGVYWGSGHKNNVSERLGGRATNNRAEILAAKKAVDQAKKFGYKNLVLTTDSEFLINGITKWVKGWKKNGWKLKTGGPVVNREEFEELDNALPGINIKWVHVRGHQGDPGNEAADKLANAGARKPLVD